MNVHLRDLTRENWEECAALQVAPEQRSFVAPNLYSIAESKFSDALQPFAIYAGEQMVGFVMYGLDPDDNNYWIYRLMIDQQHQRKGYARAALTEVLERLKGLPDCREIVLGYKPGNTEAAKLYESVGFTTSGEMLFGEIVARYLVRLAEYLDPIAYDLENPSFGPDGPFYANLAARVSGPILELGAGTGRIAIPLAQAGHRVTALDLSAPMLAHGRVKAGELPIRWVQGDSTNFDLGERYGLIFIAGHGFQAFLTEADLDGLLRSVKRHLLPGGLFAFDTRNPAPVHLEADREESDWIAYQHPQKGRVQVSGFQVYNAERQIQTWTTRRRWADTAGRPLESVSQLPLRYQTPAQIDPLLQAHGFEVVERYGDWSLAPVTAEGSELIYVARA